MLRRRKLELALTDLRRELDRITKGTAKRGSRDDTLPHAIYNIDSFQVELAGDIAKTGQLLELACLLRTTVGPGCQVAEERLMRALWGVVDHCLDALSAAGFVQGKDWPAPDSLKSPELYQNSLVFRAVHDFAGDCLNFKRPRDPFGGRRRAAAFEILGRVAFLVDLPDVVDRAVGGLRRASSAEARGAAEFLDGYFSERDESPDDAVTEALQAMAERTNH